MIWLFDDFELNLINFDKIIYLECEGHCLYAYYDDDNRILLYEDGEPGDAESMLKHYAKLLEVK